MSDYVVGEKVRLTADIYDYGEDHHPPGWLARKGEIVVIGAIYGKKLAVHHKEVTNGSMFVVFEGEYCPTLFQD